MLDIFFIVFIDGILIYSSSFDDDINHLKIVSKTLIDQQLISKIHKCKILIFFVALIFHVVSRKCTDINPKKKDGVYLDLYSL